MKCGARVALGVAGGYFLGRTKKMKLALMVAGMAAGRRAGGPAELLNQGSKLLGSSPELARLTDEVRGRLLASGKSAALAVATRQVESLTDRVGKRVESLGDLGSRPAEEEAAPAEDEGPQDESAPAERAEDTDTDTDTADEEPAPARRTARSTTASSARGAKNAQATATARRATRGTGKGATTARGTGRSTRSRRGESNG